MVISIVSALTAIGAVAFAYRSNKISRRALEIAERQQASHDAEIMSYLIDTIGQKDKDFETVAFAISYTNRSDLPNALSRLELELHYVSDGGVVNHLLFPLVDRVEVELELAKLPFVEAPLALAPRSTVSGWLVFKIPLAAKRGPVEKYRVVATTASGQRVVTECFLVRTVFDAKD